MKNNFASASVIFILLCEDMTRPDNLSPKPHQSFSITIFVFVFASFVQVRFLGGQNEILAKESSFVAVMTQIALFSRV